MTRALLIAVGGVVALLLGAAALAAAVDHRWIATAGFLVLAGAVVASVVGVLAQQRRTDFRGRVQSFIAPPGGQAGQSEAPTSPPRTATETAVELIAPEAEIAGIEPRLGQIVIGTLSAGLVIGVVVAVLISSPWGLLVALGAPLLTRTIVKRRVAGTRKSFEQQLPDNLDVVSSALRVGQSLPGAFTVTVDAADEPSRSELGRAIADEQLGVPFDVALHRVAKRMQSRDLEQVALVTRLQRDAGTNAAEVIEQVSENIRGRMDLERLVRTLTAQGRMARWIVSLLPLFLFGAMYVLNRAYLAPLWETNLGKAGMVLGLIMITAGSLTIKRIVEIEV